ncbi:Zinc/iron permease [Aspergillus ambiguus]|uniref:putative ZIP family zinc transporter n=1 Tax=Aspergillus ambiguus TaxID=176160 RepID=UPI003CCDB869
MSKADRLGIWQQGASDISVTERAATFISEIPYAVLRAELDRRSERRDVDEDKTTCGSKDRGAYNTPIHVMALFLILILSTLACSFPVLARRFPGLPIPRRFLFISRHFGTGVLIATAFVHLLPTAFVSLTDPCLPRFWSQTYRAMAGFVAMVSVFVVVVVEMIFAMKGAGHVHGSEYDHLISSGDGPDEFQSGEADYLRLSAQESMENIQMSRMDEGSSNRPAPQHENISHGHPAEDSKDADDISFDDSEPYETADSNGPNSRGYANSHSHRSHGDDPHHQGVGKLQNPQRQLLQCLLLEAGILFHSVFIGMALSVATGTSFVVLLVAICFHQTFEGFALGSRIASLIPDLFGPSSPKPWLMSLAYGTTTPIGQAIGLVLHNLYDPASTTGLLMVGITNAISSGLLLFAGLVELLAEDFLSESSYVALRGRRRVEACVAVAGGALLMAFVGAFA